MFPRMNYKRPVANEVEFTDEDLAEETEIKLLKAEIAETGVVEIPYFNDNF